jgi:hypothetical protein
MQLVGNILGLQLISQTEQMELLLNGIQPLISLQRFLRLLEERGLSVKKVLEVTMLIWFRSLTTLPSISVD